MISLGLTGAQQAIFHRTLNRSHSFRLEVDLLNLAGDHVSTVSNKVLDGQVDVDADADVTRSCTVTFLDPSHSLQLDSDSPDDGALHADRMLRVRYSVLVPDLGRRVDVPVFTGPIVAFDRDGDKVRVQALGKEALAKRTAWRPLTLKKGMQKDEAIRTILTARYGEDWFDFPAANTSRLPAAVSLGRMGIGWDLCMRFAASISRQLYYDGAGRCRLRVRPAAAGFTFRAGHPTDSNITTPLQVSHDFTELKNAVWVRGGKPKGAKRAVSAFVAAPTGHPLSPTRLGRNGVASYSVEEIDNDHLRSLKECRAAATRRLNELLLEEVGVTFDSFPIPHLDPFDVVKVQTPDFVANIRIRRFSLPLTVGGAMSVGYISRVSKPVRRGR